MSTEVSHQGEDISLRISPNQNWDSTMRLGRMQFTVRCLMVVVILVAILLAGGVFVARLVRLSLLYEARAAAACPKGEEMPPVCRRLWPTNS